VFFKDIGTDSGLCCILH